MQGYTVLIGKAGEVITNGRRVRLPVGLGVDPVSHEETGNNHVPGPFVLQQRGIRIAVGGQARLIPGVAEIEVARKQAPVFQQLGVK